MVAPSPYRPPQPHWSYLCPQNSCHQHWASPWPSITIPKWLPLENNLPTLSPGSLLWCEPGMHTDSHGHHIPVCDMNSYMWIKPQFQLVPWFVHTGLLLSPERLVSAPWVGISSTNVFNLTILSWIISCIYASDLVGMFMSSRQAKYLVCKIHIYNHLIPLRADWTLYIEMQSLLVGINTLVNYCRLKQFMCHNIIILADTESLANNQPPTLLRWTWVVMSPSFKLTYQKAFLIRFESCTLTSANFWASWLLFVSVEQPRWFD